MKEFKTIVAEYDKIDFTVRKAAIATVVKVRGSSYRSPGARMLITDDGKWVGSISGGCLEGDALRKARQVMLSGAPMAVTYDTREDSNQKLGIGLGCNGVIDVLIEPVTGENDPVIALFRTIVESETPVALGTVIRGGVNTASKVLIDDSGNVIYCSHEDNIADELVTDLKSSFATKRSETKIYHVGDAEVEVFIELVQPCVRLMIFGGGFDARPVSQLAKSLGWNVTVTDECVAHIAPVFFPDADRLSLCDRTFVDRDFAITPYTACVLMSHNYEYDRDVLQKLLQTPTPYIGILGPRKRFDKMIAEYGEKGIELTKHDYERIHSPIGLDIGAETPDEIALSITGEIQGKFAQRSGGFLKYRSGPIHTREGKNDQVFKQVYLSPRETRRMGSE